MRMVADTSPPLVNARNVSGLRPGATLANKRAQVRTKVAELLDLQDSLYQRALDPETSPKDVAALTRAFVEADKQVRQLRGQAALAPIKSESRRKARSSSQALVRVSTEP